MRRRHFVTAASGIGAALLAGCSGDGGGGGGGDGGYGGGGGGGGGSGSFRLLISDQPAAISDFESLNVTLSSARIFRADEDEEITSAAVTETEEPAETDTTTVEPTTPETETEEPAETEEADDEDGESVVELDLGGVTVDLTEVVGDRAVSVLESELEEGRYSGIELRVAAAEGVVDGETVAVKVPSNRLRIVRPFEIAADEELSFVFDINVVKRGPNGYNLLPVIGKSGVVGEDVEDIEEVDDDDDEETATTAATDDGGEAGEQAGNADN